MKTWDRKQAWSKWRWHALTRKHEVPPLMRVDLKAFPLFICVIKLEFYISWSASKSLDLICPRIQSALWTEYLGCFLIFEQTWHFKTRHVRHFWRWLAFQGRATKTAWGGVGWCDSSRRSFSDPAWSTGSSLARNLHPVVCAALLRASVPETSRRSNGENLPTSCASLPRSSLWLPICKL